MADNHAYVPAPGTVVPVINHLRGSFPTTITADTLKKLGFAPKNESYVLNVLRFLGLIDESGKKTDDAAKIFSIHDDSSFSKAFGERVKAAYTGLFDLHGDKTWELDSDSLITFFRQSDQTSAITGKRQAATFQILAGFAGHGDMPQTKAANSKKTMEPSDKQGKVKAPTPVTSNVSQKPNVVQQPPIGLTVRIEINLPADGNQETYDRIFKSLRENLING